MERKCSIDSPKSRENGDCIKIKANPMYSNKNLHFYTMKYKVMGKVVIIIINMR